MSENTVDFKLKPIVRGDTFTGLRLDFFQSDNITPLDLTACSILMQYRVTPEALKIDYQFWTGDDTITIPDPPSGQAFLAPRIMQTKGIFYTDIQITKSNGVIISTQKGIATISQDVSRLQV